MNVPVAAGAGTPIDVSEHTAKYVHVIGTIGGGTPTIEGSMDGTNWISVGGVLASNTLVSIPQTLKQLRIAVASSALTGTSFVFGGANSRTS